MIVVHLFFTQQTTLVSVALLHYKTHNLPIAVELTYFNSALKYAVV